MKVSIPKSLLDFISSLPWDERGIIGEIPAGGALTYANTHTDLVDPYGTPVSQHNPHPEVNGANKVMLYDRIVPSDWVVPAPPPTGVAVWQIKGRDCRIVRTSKLHNYGIGPFVIGVLSPAGPYPGVPIQNDSGSLTFVRMNGMWKVLGICNFGQTTNLPFWPHPIRITHGAAIGSMIPSNIPENPQEAHWDLNWTRPEEPIIDINTVTPESTNNQASINMRSRHSITIKNASAPVSKVVLTGINGDRWERPTNSVKGYWPVDVNETPEGIALCWDVSQTQGPNYNILVVFDNGASLTKTGIATGVVIDLKSSLIAGSPTPQPTQPPQPISPDTELKAHIARLEEALVEQRIKVSMLTAELERLNDIKNSIDRLGKAMGWSR